MDLHVARFDPLLPEQGPAHEHYTARGLALLGALKYVERSTPGGLSAVRRELRGHPYQAYFDQIFLAQVDYNAAALLTLFRTAALLEGKPIAEFIRDRANDTAEADVRGTYRQMLSRATPEAVARKLPSAFNRYFRPCTAHVMTAVGGMLEVELRGLPHAMAGMYIYASQGFVSRCLELGNAHEVQYQHGQLQREVVSGPVPTCRASFVATWEAAS